MVARLMKNATTNRASLCNEHKIKMYKLHQQKSY